MYPFNCTAQIFNEIGDYEALAKALKELLCKQEELVSNIQKIL
jgi:hypothetical protein